MAWQDILSNFKEQFQALGPEKYSNIDNPDMRYELAGQRSAGLKEGAKTAANVISQNVQESQKAAEAAAAAKKEKGYTREYNKVGGYTFKDPNGKEVSPFEFALNKGVPLTVALEGSYDQGDRNFVEDYDAMETSLRLGEFDQKTAMQKLSQDHPRYFGIQGEGGSAIKDKSFSDKTTTIQQKYESFKPKQGIFQKNDVLGILTKSYVDRLGSLRTREDAERELNRIRTSKDYQRMDFKKKEEFEKTVGEITDTIHPNYGKNYGVGMF